MYSKNLFNMYWYADFVGKVKFFFFSRRTSKYVMSLIVSSIPISKTMSYNLSLKWSRTCYWASTKILFTIKTAFYDPISNLFYYSVWSSLNLNTNEYTDTTIESINWNKCNVNLLGHRGIKLKNTILCP